jgi:hypothetical protein
MSEEICKTGNSISLSMLSEVAILNKEKSSYPDSLGLECRSLSLRDEGDPNISSHALK